MQQGTPLGQVFGFFLRSIQATPLLHHQSLTRVKLHSHLPSGEERKRMSQSAGDVDNSRFVSAHLQHQGITIALKPTESSTFCQRARWGGKACTYTAADCRVRARIALDSWFPHAHVTGATLQRRGCPRLRDRFVAFSCKFIRASPDQQLAVRCCCNLVQDSGINL